MHAQVWPVRSGPQGDAYWFPLHYPHQDQVFPEEVSTQEEPERVLHELAQLRQLLIQWQTQPSWTGEARSALSPVQLPMICCGYVSVSTAALFKYSYKCCKHVKIKKTQSFQLAETSARYARKISGTTALQEALKEKQQHIEQLLAERDLERCEVAKATSHAGAVQQELLLLRKGRDQVRRWLQHVKNSTTHPPRSHEKEDIIINRILYP